MIEHERLPGEQERRQTLHVRISELRDLGTVNRVVRPDWNDAGRLDGRQRARGMVAEGRNENGNRHDRQNVETVATLDCWSRAKRPGSCREHDSAPREKHLRREHSGGHAAQEQDEARGEAAEQDRHRVVRRVRVADRPCDDDRSSDRDDRAAEEQPGHRGRIERCAAGRQHRAGECRQHEPVQHCRHASCGVAFARIRRLTRAPARRSSRCRRHRTAPSRSTAEIGSAARSDCRSEADRRWFVRTDDRPPTSGAARSETRR